MVTQNIQWLLLMGSTFVVSVLPPGGEGLQRDQDRRDLQRGHGRDPRLVARCRQRLARKHAQRTLIRGRVSRLTLVGIGLLLGLYKAHFERLGVRPRPAGSMGLGVGVMLTPSVNVVQSAFPEEKQGEISGLSRAVSNLGSSLGTAIAGTIVVADASAGNSSYVAAMITSGRFRADRSRRRCRDSRNPRTQQS